MCAMNTDFSPLTNPAAEQAGCDLNQFGMISQFSENMHQPQIMNFLLRLQPLDLDLPGCPEVRPGSYDMQHSPCSRLCGAQSFVVCHSENTATEIFGTY
jgi:hypothetical protein